MKPPQITILLEIDNVDGHVGVRFRTDGLEDASPQQQAIAQIYIHAFKQCEEFLGQISPLVEGMEVSGRALTEAEIEGVSQRFKKGLNE